MASFRVLGPVEAWSDESRLMLGGRQQVKLLAFLLLSANRALSADAAIDAVWGSEREGAIKRLQMGVLRLRRSLSPLDGEDGSRVRTVSGGYLFSVGPGELDAEVFAERVRDGRHALEGGDPARASELLAEALGLWRGPPLAEVAFEDFAQAEIRRLEELRLVALETRIDADLELGRNAGLVAELEALLAEQPTRERLAGQLMTALYSAGRQAAALEVYQRTRAELAEQLGLEPGPALKTLQSEILEQAATLNPSGPNGTARPPGSLPVPATPFLGRERELVEVTGLLRVTGTRLLTLTGAGGSGKTRLALRVAEGLAAEYRDGAWFVAFADITDPELIVPTICHALGLDEQPGLTPDRQLRGLLRERELLLVLDNLERLTEGTLVLGEVLASCQGLRMIATSREPLQLAAEQLYEVPVLEPSDAIELFTSRAVAVASRLTVDPEIAGQICERLDRLPLALELAAARTKMLAPAEILARLEHRLPALASGPRDAPRRQQTLEATIDWSHQLLNGKEQRLFARLAVFAGGCTLTAAEAVCDARLDTLEALIDRSLLRTDGSRYWMFQTIREYALDRLEQSGEADALRRRHHRWFSDLLDAEALDVRDLYSGSIWLKMQSVGVGSERENIKSAVAWALQQGLGHGWTRG